MQIDLVMSDMAPRASGIKDLDHENIISLAYAALSFAVLNSVLGGNFLCKVRLENHRHSCKNSDGSQFHYYILKTFQCHETQE